MTEDPKTVDAGTVSLEGTGISASSAQADLVVWSKRQAALLRRIAAGEQVNEPVDWENVAEEIESVGASERRGLASHVRNVIEHLAKLAASPAHDPRDGWQATIQRARADIEDLLEASPSLKRELDQVVAHQHKRGLELAASEIRRHNETPLVPPTDLRFTTDQVVGDWLPIDNPIP